MKERTLAVKLSFRGVLLSDVVIYCGNTFDGCLPVGFLKECGLLLIAGLIIQTPYINGLASVGILVLKNSGLHSVWSWASIRFMVLWYQYTVLCTSKLCYCKILK